MHDEIWCLMKFSMRAIILMRNKHAEEHIKSIKAQCIKSIRAPSGLRLQLDPIKFQKNESCNLAKINKNAHIVDPLED